MGFALSPLFLILVCFCFVFNCYCNFVFEIFRLVLSRVLNACRGSAWEWAGQNRLGLEWSIRIE